MDTPSNGPETHPHERSIQPIEDYLERVRLFLVGFSLTDREKIIDGIRGKILTQYQREGELRKTLRRLGSPEATATLVIVYTQLAEASKSWSPFQVARAAGHRKILGALGLLTGVIVLLGYGATAICFGCSALILLFPWMAERWLGRFPADSSLNVELPLAAVALGILAYIATMLVSHFLFRRLGAQPTLPLGPPRQLVPW
jgi:uncharacterized membrane protein